jgi:MoaA/NifB/PqqE/SkfB family radical SAM enzyme
MTLKTFKNYVKLCEERDCGIEIGGGEPTVHPQFWKFMEVAIASDVDVWLCTNGKKTRTALRLLGMALDGTIRVSLSLDKWHDPISERVMREFEDNAGCHWGSVSLKRAYEGVLIKAGRTKHGLEQCFCDTIFIKTSGDVYGCACGDAPHFGNVNDVVDVPDYWDDDTCSKYQYKPWACVETRN